MFFIWHQFISVIRLIVRMEMHSTSDRCTNFCHQLPNGLGFGHCHLSSASDPSPSHLHSHFLPWQKAFLLRLGLLFFLCAVNPHMFHISVPLLLRTNSQELPTIIRESVYSCFGALHPSPCPEPATMPILAVWMVEGLINPAKAKPIALPC